MKVIPIVVASTLALIGTTASAADQVSQDALRTAASKGLTLLERTSPTFLKKGGCNSCHNQMLPAAAQAFARSRGVPTGDLLAQLAPDLSLEQTTERYLEYSVAAGSGVNGIGFDLFGRALAHEHPDARILSQIHFIKSMQAPDGHWRGGRDRRPPLSFDEFTTTAFMIFALNAFAPASDVADTTASIARARTWLMTTKAERTQERAFRLLGLAWSKGDAATIESAVTDLRSLQRPDGGWSQLPTLATDAYATGMALYALANAGVAAADSAYQAGLRYLLSTQAADGTWHVTTRAVGFQPYFESGYPYEQDQWISAAGTAYAIMGIAAALEVPQATAQALAR
jgi:Squalene-hopene cyclase C-terminal domain/Prenyltransferase and squalene oxidase repeat